MSGRVEDRCGVVTGAGGGIGAAVSRQVVANGGKVVMVDLHETSLKEAAADIAKEFGEGKVVVLRADVSKSADVKASVDLCVSKFGKIDFYHANAGVLGKFVPIEEETEESFERTLRINTMGPFFAIKYAAPAMKETAGAGSIVITSSIASLRADLTPLQYAASKGAVNSMMISASDRLLLDQVRVNAVVPGGVMTNMVVGVAKEMDEAGLEIKGYDAARYVTADPDDIAKVVLFLISDESISVKGHALVADGGMSNSMGSQPHPTKKVPRGAKKSKL